MTIEPNDISPIDPNTDDLNSFEDLFHGKVAHKEAEKVEKVEKVEEEEVEEILSEDGTEDKDTGKEDEAPDGDDDSDKNPAPKKKNRFQERINELTAKAREAERALEELRREREIKQETPKTAPTPVQDQFIEPDPNAKLEDGSDKYPLGEFDPKYLRDMARATIEREWSAKQQQEDRLQAERQIQAERQEIQNQWNEKLSIVAEQQDDYLDKILELEGTFSGLDPTYSDYLVQTIKSLSNGPEVLGYFADHLDEAKEFVQMGALKATLALGEINSMFKGQSRKEAKVSSAPPPPQLNKGSKVRKSVSDDTEDLEAFSQKFFAKKR